MIVALGIAVLFFVVALAAHMATMRLLREPPPPWETVGTFRQVWSGDHKRYTSYVAQERDAERRVKIVGWEPPPLILNRCPIYADLLAWAEGGPLPKDVE